MPKAEKGSLKDIGKRIKAKGLQKLKFYCQVCQKQCRDANGFKCHIQSESHLRQIKLFSENAGGRMDQYSREFEAVFLTTLRTRHSTMSVNANNVYQEVIQDKHHIHMNSTIWATLSDFVKYLGKKGKCTVKETERGWYIAYIEQDIGKLQRAEALAKRQEAEQQAEEALNVRLEQQRVEAAKAFDRVVGSENGDRSFATRTATNLERDDDNTETLQVTLKKAKTAKSNGQKKTKKSSVFGDDDEEEEEEEEDPEGPEPPPIELPFKKKRSGDRAANGGTKTSKTHKRDKEIWVHKDILVRIITKRPLDKTRQSYYKRKAVVDTVGTSTARVTVLDSGPNDQDGGQELDVAFDDLETVIPKRLGKNVLIVRGPHSGQIARLLDLDAKRQLSRLRLETTQSVLENIHYDDFSKLA